MTASAKTRPEPAASVSREDLSFTVGDGYCAAWHHRGPGCEFVNERGSPCIVMGHGLSGTSDSGLESFAQRFAAAGLQTLSFDYRHLGRSSGEPRQLVSAARQLDDYRAAIRLVRELSGVDPDRIILWGVSFSAGHVLQLAAEDPRIAAAIALTPAWDGLAQFLSVLRRDGPLQPARLSVTAMRDIAAAVTGRPAVTVAVSGRPGEVATLTAPDAYESMTAIGGATWRNEIVARFLVQVLLYRPTRHARRLNCPLLVQVADNDLNSPPRAAIRVARKARAEVRHYPCDHFDVFTMPRWQHSAIEHQLAFVRRHLA
jgi:pimeloyl-ACP methyl ester carboxylesterase